MGFFNRRKRYEIDILKDTQDVKNIGLSLKDKNITDLDEREIMIIKMTNSSVKENNLKIYEILRSKLNESLENGSIAQGEANTIFSLILESEKIESSEIFLLGNNKIHERYRELRSKIFEYLNYLLENAKK